MAIIMLDSYDKVAVRHKDPAWLKADKAKYDALIAMLDFHGPPEERHKFKQRYDMARYEFQLIDATFPEIDPWKF